MDLIPCALTEAVAMFPILYLCATDITAFILFPMQLDVTLNDRKTAFHDEVCASIKEVPVV